MTPQDDPLAPARGICWAIPLSILLWCALALFAAWVAL
jgi:hypothetical protein